MSKLIREAQKLTPDTVVHLFDLDLTDLGGSVSYFTPEIEDPDAPVINWRENEYIPLPISAEGFELSSTGQFPRPKITLANVLGTLKSEMEQYNNLVGATVTRWRTFAKHLDDGADPDPDIYFPPDVYRIDRKANETPIFVEFELASVIDQQGVYLPRRQILRNTCTHIYRVWDATNGVFDYSKATCPYAGANYFNENGTVTALPEEDQCSKLLDSGCKKRFPGEPLPTRAFPGVGRFK